MAEHSPEQDQFEEPGDLSENTSAGTGLEGAPADVFEPGAALLITLACVIVPLKAGIRRVCSLQ